MAPEIDITPEGLAAVRAELDELTRVRRPNIVEKIKSARELGDLSENFEYHSAKNEQGFIESRIQELEQIVKNHRLIEAGAPSGVVRLGSTVRFNEDGGPEESYRIVGPAEADPAQGRVSNESAMGRALLGGKAGEEVEVVTDSGSSYRVKILAIE
ncbi:MAG: transcription elongation factor GreA [Chloroflexi bacterium]|nr:MAG: transcription elongation factor GreA [Chloroflexota bacterium]TMD53994.1 MAG: transcription elongation factor GreA [Chloroflexota bacterium]